MSPDMFLRDRRSGAVYRIRYARPCRKHGLFTARTDCLACLRRGWWWLFRI